MNRYVYAIRDIDSDTIYSETFECLEDAEFMLDDVAYRFDQDKSDLEIVQVRGGVKRA